jgi:PEP-CTERM/exosortase A-associated glycosyltransferase
VHPDVIHAHSPVLCAIPAILTAKIHRIPIVYEIRAFWEDAAVASKKFSEMSSIYWAIRTIETYVCKRVDRVVTICQAMKSDLVLRGISQDKIFVVPNGVDPIVFENKDKNPNLVSRLGLEEKFVFGYIGTFYDFEGVDDLVDAFHKLHEQEENVALLLVGGGETEGAIKERLKKFNADHIIFVGKVPHEKVFDYYTLVDVMIYPRKSTRVTEMTTPLKPLEAMALGKPIICSSVGGMVELVGIDNGLYFKPGNVNELIECCMRLIRNPLLRKQIGEKGRNRALRERTWKDIINKYADIYKI